MVYPPTVIGVSGPKLAATRAALREALDETEDQGARFYIREALQHLDTLERRQDREDDGTDADGNGVEDDGAVPVLTLGSPGDSTAGIDPDGLETAEFLAHEFDRN